MVLFHARLSAGPFLPDPIAAFRVEAGEAKVSPEPVDLDELFGEREIGVNFVGVQPEYRHESVTFAKLIERRRSAMQAAPAQFEDAASGAANATLAAWLADRQIGAAEAELIPITLK